MYYYIIGLVVELYVVLHGGASSGEVTRGSTSLLLPAPFKSGSKTDAASWLPFEQAVPQSSESVMSCLADSSLSRTHLPSEASTEASFSCDGRPQLVNISGEDGEVATKLAGCDPHLVFELAQMIVHVLLPVFADGRAGAAPALRPPR